MLSFAFDGSQKSKANFMKAYQFILQGTKKNQLGGTTGSTDFYFFLDFLF